MSQEHEDSIPYRAAQFESTLWSLVLEAGHRSSPDARLALEELCGLYWYPLYAYVRRRGYPLHEAQDLTQEFFARLLETHAIEAADPNRGRFRSFLLASLRNFLANEWDKRQARKRGGTHVGGVYSVAFSPDGRRLASGASDGGVKLWEIPLGDEIVTLDSGTRRVFSLAFSSDGEILVAANEDETVTIWRAPVP